MPPPGSDAAQIDDLLPRLRALDDDAFTALYDLMSTQLLTFTNGLLADRPTAEDVVQETFVALTRTVRKFRGDGRALLAWLYTTARRRCIDHRRRHRTTRERPVASPPETATAPAVTDVDPAVSAALQRLTEAQRTAIVLRRVLGYSGEEVGALMGIERDAVYALCARGERALREQLASDDEPPERREG